jgi:DNA-binding response OmpR family regulator
MTQPRRILVVEDDPAIRQGLVDALRFDGYEVLEAADAPRGREAALRSPIDLVLLDLMLPGGDGFDVLADVRRERQTLPVIVLTARGREADRVRGLKLGADDYVVKPFSVRELLARVQAVLRRSPERQRGDVETFEIPGGEVDLSRCEVRFTDGARAELSEREVDLLRYLASNPGRALSRDEILTRVWRLSPAAHGRTRTIDMHVARLREKLRDPKSKPAVILTVRGKGYMFGVSP